MTPQQEIQAATELANRSLLAYCVMQWPGYRIGPHLRVAAKALEDLEAGRIRRLMIQMPPRHGKSMLASENFPAWYLGRNPHHYVIASTYGQDLADDFGRKVRDQLADPLFQDIFPGVKLKGDGRSAKRFIVQKDDRQVEGGIDIDLELNGAYYAVGAGGPMTGRGAHLLAIDDPIKNREDADSEVGRRALKDWYTSTAYTRLMPGGRILVIQTRWNEDDLSGWLEEAHAFENWTIVRMPAVCDDPAHDPLGRAMGEALWPEQYPITTLNEIRQALTTGGSIRDWTALYQQKPAPDEGIHFKDEMFRPYDALPPASQLTFYGGSDYATKDGKGDYTVHLVIAVDQAGLWYIVDLWRAQTQSDEWIDAWCDLVVSWAPIGWGEETGQISNSVGPFLAAEARKRNALTHRVGIASTTSKLARAQSVIGLAATHGIRYPRGAPWWPAFLAELKAFPGGKHDDQVDALSIIGQLQHKLLPGKRSSFSHRNPEVPPGMLLLPPAPDDGTSHGSHRIKL